MCLPRQKKWAANFLLLAVLVLCCPYFRFHIYPMGAYRFSNQSINTMFRDLKRSFPKIQGTYCYQYHGNVYIGLAAAGKGREMASQIVAAAQNTISSDAFISDFITQDPNTAHIRKQTDIYLQFYQNFGTPAYCGYVGYMEEGHCFGPPEEEGYEDNFQTWTGRFAWEPEKCEMCGFYVENFFSRDI